MKIFLDTANLDEIRQGVALGVVDGVTTNPTLVAKENKPFREHILEICKIVKDGVVNAEVVSTDFAGILREAHEVATWHPNIVVKIPMIPDGVRALSVLVEGRHPRQHHAGLLGDAGASGGQSRRIFRQPVPRAARRHLRRRSGVAARHPGNLSRLWISRRRCSPPACASPIHVLEAAKMGSHIGTMPFKVFRAVVPPSADRQRACRDSSRIGRRRARCSAISWSRCRAQSGALKIA